MLMDNYRPGSSWVTDANVALFTDYYQLTMLQAYYREQMKEMAVFDLFVRRLKQRNYLLACGLDDVLTYLEQLRFTPQSLEYLSSMGAFDSSFIDWLEHFRFTGDVYAVREGTPMFADEPLLEVIAPIAEGQLVETFLLNQVTFQTGIASKAARVVREAAGRSVVDFGMRRMHGTDAAMKAARACYIAGVNGTSNVLASKVYGIKPVGTMAHSYIEAHTLEVDALKAFGNLYPGTTLLVDTYDTLEAVRHILDLFQRSNGAFRPGAIRLDSGDLADLARRSRELLDSGGLTDVKILASGSLDEFSIRNLVASGAPIDGFGVGTRLGTMADQPYLDSAYKLSAYAGAGRMKLSSEKSSVPCPKQVYRYFEGGKAVRDVVVSRGEELDGTPLLECVMRTGKRTEAGSRTLDDARRHASDCLGYLPDRLFALETAELPYPVTLSPKLQERAESTRRALTDGGQGPATC